MRNTVIYLLFLTCLLPAACALEESYEADFVPVEYVSPKSVKLKTDGVFPTPITMIVSDGSLILTTAQNSPKAAFQIVPLPLTGESFLAGSIGRGPNDFMGVDFAGLKALNIGFAAPDNLGYKRCHLEGRQIVVDEIDAVIAGVAQNGITAIKNGYIDLASPSSEYEFVLYNKKGKIEKEISKMPDFARDSDEPPFSIYLKRFAVKPDQKLIAVFYSHFDRMKIMDMIGRTVREQITDFGVTRYSKDDFSRQCYGWVFSVTDDYIPVLHRNDENTEIQVWDWSGNLKKRFILPGRKVLASAVDWEHSKLYYTRSDVEDTVFEADFQI